MKLASIILSIMPLWLLTSCMAMDSGIMETESISLNGIVTDEECNPIDHIKVTLEWNDPAYSPLIAYTSTRGEFHADLEFCHLQYPATVSIELTDMDGPANGGEFETKTDEITILEEGALETIIYRLTRATASESIQQSL